MANKAMSPSTETISAGQIGKAQELIGAALRKSGLPFAETQQVLEAQGDELATNYVADLRKRVEAITGLITRRVKVDRTRTPQQVLDATGRKQYTDKKVVATMPHGEGDEVEVVFFKIGRYVSDVDLDKEYELRGLKPADPYSQAQVNIDDPAFADDRPNGTHWKVGDSWHFAAFDQWSGDGRYVSVYRYDDDWDDYWWFAGVRK